MKSERELRILLEHEKNNYKISPTWYRKRVINLLSYILEEELEEEIPA